MSKGLGDIKGLGNIKTLRRKGMDAMEGEAGSPYLKIYNAHLKKEKERLEKELSVFETRTAAIREKLGKVHKELEQLEGLHRPKKGPRGGEDIEDIKEEPPKKKWKKVTLSY